MSATDPICYVYALLDPADGEAFYVGMGRGDRMHAHLRPSQLKNGVNQRKMDCITGIMATGKRPIAVKLVEGLTPFQAKRVEADMIVLLRPQITNAYAPDHWQAARGWAARTLKTIQKPTDQASMGYYHAIVADLERLAA